ncbi:histidine kinase [Deinococcus indicus]|uniref:ATP-binding protein n=1 Tax=Deinococcus indicus TaxID=223556 RepID=UPI0019CC1029|nr:ATP-binding protein [Deinococcus indicus]GHG28674.1 histidine kinase [Deinococcus indicus]
MTGGGEERAPGEIRTARLGEPVDLTNCDREPIHIPGAAQPHGVMLVLRDDQAVQVSGNTAQHFGLEVAEVLDGGLERLLEPEVLERVRASLRSEPLDDNPLFLLSAPAAGRGLFDLIAHRRAGLTILEFEAVNTGRPRVDAYAEVKRALNRLNSTSGLAEFTSVLAREVQQLTGFDRVMVYQFGEDGTGTVIAEERRDDLTPFLGLRYPASDIPRQARALYVQNPLRIIADVSYEPAPMFSQEAGSEPLDMSYCVLRSVSPVHIQYLKNMGVGASMSVSLVHGKELWGLIACHHQTPRHLPYDLRSACELLGQVASVQVSARQEQLDQSYRLNLKAAQTQLVERMAEERDLLEALVGSDTNLLQLIHTPGAAVILNGETVLLGVTPPREQIQALQMWLDVHADGDVLHTAALSQEYPPAAAFTAQASGLLAVRLSQSRHDYVMWFRPEELQTVTWGGDPNKPVEVAPDGSERLTPRRSFEAWMETVRGRSRPWLPEELAAARALRRAIMSVVLRRMDELGALNDHLERSNADLERSNADLDAFAYIASHDLKEPLRGLHNYSVFLLEAYEHQLDEDGAAKLRTLVRLTQRMDALIDSLLLYSRVGRMDLSFRATDLNELMREVLDVLSPRLEQLRVNVQVAPDLPTLTVDRVRTGEIFSNLITNAMKYNDKPQPAVQIGTLRPEERADLPVPAGVPDHATILFVSDNGIGIREKHFENIFRIFKRLHARDQFGGGTGAGLTIVRKIVERHGGQIWVNSEYGQGSVFYFTLET